MTEDHVYDRTRAIIIAAGDATRWNNHKKIPKHFAMVDGEPIIKRTVALLQGYDCDVHVVAKTPRYKINGSQLYIPSLKGENADADKFLSSRELWNELGRTVILYGDVYFTGGAMDKIMNHPHPGWNLFGRVGASSFTGGNHGECFAISFYHDYIPEFEAALRRIINLWFNGRIDRCGGWEVYKAMIKMPDDVFFFHDEPLVGRRFTNIDDWTEDFDWPIDYETFLARRKEAGL
jgi:hypothetical protein